MYFRRSDDDSPEVTAMWAQFGGSIAHRVRLRQQEYVKGPIPSLRMLKSKKRHSFLLLWWPHTEIRANLFSFRKIFSLSPPLFIFHSKSAENKLVWGVDKDLEYLPSHIWSLLHKYPLG